MKKFTFAFLGLGNIARAIIGGGLKSVYITKSDVTGFDPSPEAADYVNGLGIEQAAALTDAVKSAKYIFLTVKPQIYPLVLNEISPVITGEHVLVSVAPGYSTKKICEIVGRQVKVVRTMPNTPLLLGEGAVAACLGDGVIESDFEPVAGLFRESGLLKIINEDLMDAVVAVNGSSPAYVFLMAKAAVDWAESEGIDRNTAMELFAKTLSGAASMLSRPGASPDSLISAVKSPRGTTEAALNAMEEAGFTAALTRGMNACMKRSLELSGS